MYISFIKDPSAAMPTPEAFMSDGGMGVKMQITTMVQKYNSLDPVQKLTCTSAAIIRNK